MKVIVEKFNTLDESKSHAKRLIDERAEEVRTHFITPGGGQAMEYEAAAREAEKYLSGQDGPFPMLEADVEAGRVETLEEAAQLVFAVRSQWEPIGATIRKIRLKGKVDVDGASSQKEVAGVREGVLQQLDNIRINN